MVTARDAPSTVRRYVYGLEVESTVHFPGAKPPRGGTKGRRVSLTQVSRAQIARSWRPRETKLIIDQRAPNGRRVMSVEHAAEIGYLITVPWYGTHVVSKDGHEIRSALPTVSVWRWYKLLFGQVLPLATALQGLPLLHASAVATDEGALGFVASAGTGKSSVAMHLIARGARFVTDDVMAIELTAHDIRVHPGPGMTNVHSTELRKLNSNAGGVVGEVLGRSDKVQVAMTPVERAVPLAALFLLERSDRFDRLQIVRDRHADAGRLLGSGFIPYVETYTFLTRHLDVCAHIAKMTPVFQVSIPLSSEATEVADAIAQHAGL